MYKQLLMLFGQSLKKASLKIIRGEKPHLFYSNRKKFKNACFKSVTNKYSIFLIFPALLLIYYIGTYIGPLFFTYIKMKDGSRSMIDQRISNIFTFLGGCLAVIAWFFTNLGIKEPHAYKLIFRNSYLYTAFYYIISLIVIMLLSSLWFEQVSDKIKINMIFAIHYLVILGLTPLIALVVQFVRVVDSKFFIRKYGEEFLSEVKNEYLAELIWQTSQTQYANLLKSNGFQIYSPHFFSQTQLNNHIGIDILPVLTNHGTVQQQQYEIEDINMGNLSIILQNIPKNHVNYFASLPLDSSYVVGSKAWFLNKANPIQDELLQGLKNSVILKKSKQKSSYETKDETAYSILSKKLSDYVRSDDKENVEEILLTFRNAYDIVK